MEKKFKRCPCKRCKNQHKGWCNSHGCPIDAYNKYFALNCQEYEYKKSVNMCSTDKRG